MEDTPHKQPVMVSRLPKFSSARAPPAVGPVPNGSVPSALGKGVPLGRQNGVIRVSPPLPAKAKEEKGPDLGDEDRDVLRSQQQARPAGSGRQIKKPSAGAVSKVKPSAARTISPSTKTSPRPAAGPKTPCNGRPVVNGVAPGRGSSSSESLKSLSVDTVVRSQSFTYLKSPGALSNPPLTRSFSFNRAAELSKELPRPLAELPVARSPVAPGPFGISKTSITSLPASALKKPLLPSYSGSKPSALGCKFGRPSLMKQPSPVRSTVPVKTGSTGGDALSPEHFSEPSGNTTSDGVTPEEPHAEAVAASQKENLGLSLEVLEDMSMSSASSLERNDISEEYMDDFDDLGNGGGILLIPVHGEERRQTGVCQRRAGSSLSSLHSYTSETMDWAEMGLTGGRRSDGGGSRHSVSRALSAVRDMPHGSSLDLSPSDSSGGTYMWDEEVLEPLGPGPQLCQSYDSNLNSLDILNNLENLDSCDLEEDDLMLDVDLPEDLSLHSDADSMSRYERSDSDYWPWRTRQQCRRRRESSLSTDDRAGVQGLGDGSVSGSRRPGSGQVSLDELMLKHMAQDCSSVKDQLLKLRRLLQMEEEEEGEEFLSSPSDEEQSYQQQVEDLLKEVQVLREELRLKDRLISRLTQHTTPPADVTTCLCQQREPERAAQRRERQDKSTQTPWRTQNSQVLQPSRVSTCSHSKLARLPSRTPTEAPSDHLDAQTSDSTVMPQPHPIVSPASAPENVALLSNMPTTVPTAVAAPSEPLILLLNNRLVNVQHDGVPNRNASGGLQPSGRSLKGSQNRSERGTLATPRLPLSSGGLQRTKHLPPPTRGLTCISLASKAARAPEFTNSSISRLPKPKTH